MRRATSAAKESNGSHRKIIDLYNSHKPLARGYAVKYTDAWCSTFASAVAIAAGLTDIIPTECGCEKHIRLFKNIGSWVENDAYVPSPGDYIFYDWDDNGAGDCTGNADHIGIVEKVSGNTITVIEGNMNDAVGRRNLTRKRTLYQRLWRTEVQQQGDSRRHDHRDDIDTRAEHHLRRYRLHSESRGHPLCDCGKVRDNLSEARRLQRDCKPEHYPRRNRKSKPLRRNRKHNRS